jgi:hypothetical protein
MFSKLFGKKKPYTAFEAPAASLRFLGEPTGSGVPVLEAELSTILAVEGNTRKAYLRRVQYPGEDRIRLALVIDGKEPPDVMAMEIAKKCEPLVAIDIIFLKSLNSTHAQAVRDGAPPFYVVAGA